MQRCRAWAYCPPERQRQNLDIAEFRNLGGKMPPGNRDERGLDELERSERRRARIGCGIPAARFSVHQPVEKVGQLGYEVGLVREGLFLDHRHDACGGRICESDGQQQGC